MITQDLSIFELVSNASILVKGVLLLLLATSVISWYWIFRKSFAIRQAQTETSEFERNFWSGGDLHTLYEQATRTRQNAGSMERIFEAGYQEFTKLRNQHTFDISTTVAGAKRAMRASYQREMDQLEAHLAFLASVGSVSPYVGLLGTVWGIMNAFRGLSSVSSATLAQVAPGIAEALVATAIGLFAAIPAVVAYNRFTHDIDRIAIRLESFMEEFLNILQRQVA